MTRADEIVGFHAIIPTPARVGAERWDATSTVDVEETARLVDQLIRDGAAGIIALGTTGECATLSNDDFDTVVKAVVDGAAGRVPTYIGATTLGTYETVRRLRFISDAGATGSLVGLPMWQPCTTEMAVDFYRDISSATDLDLMVYANARAFRYTFPVEFWEAVHHVAPRVTSAKVSAAPKLVDMITATEGGIHFMPSDMKLHEFHALSPETTTSCWATAASMGPEPSLALLDAVRRGDRAAIDAAADDIAWANEPIAPLLADQDVFASYNIQIERVRIEEAGYCRPGPLRPPYGSIPEPYAHAARECGRRWRTLREKLVDRRA